MEKSLFDDEDDANVDPLSWLSSEIAKSETPSQSFDNQKSETVTEEKSSTTNPLVEVTFESVNTNENSEPITTTTSTDIANETKVDKEIEEPANLDDPLLNNEPISQEEVVVQLQIPHQEKVESIIDPFVDNPLSLDIPSKIPQVIEHEEQNIENNQPSLEVSVQHEERIPLLAYNMETPSGPPVPEKNTMDDTRFFEDPANSSMDKPRVHAIDFMRGFAVICTIIGNNQGNNDHRYIGVTEAPWDGLRFADIIEPMFLFVLGMSIPLSLPTPITKKNGINPKAWVRILVRTFILLILALALDVMQNDFDMSQFKFTGVLQRIAVFYVVCAISHQAVGNIYKWITPAILMSTYLIFMCVLWVPDCGQGKFSDDCNAAGYIDRKLFGDRVHQPTDKEGFFSMLSAIFIAFLGLEFGEILTSSEFTYRGKAVFWGVFSISSIAVGSLISLGLPVNHSVWSLSYVGITAGLNGIIFGCLYLLLDVKLISTKLKIANYRWVLGPIRWFGTNAFVIYLVFALVEIWFQTNIKVDYNGDKKPVWIWIYWKVFAVWMQDKKFASLFISVIWLAFGWILVYILSIYRLFLRV